MGGEVQYAVSGGAPLGTRLGHFYRGIGVIVLEGYGLTETTAPATVNVPEKVKIGTVGTPLPGVGIRIADDGEILHPGRQRLRAATATTTPRPRRRCRTAGSTPATSASSTTTGSCKITGRKKELLVTAGGKNVAPAVLEDRLRAHPLVSQCIVVGDQKPFIAALLTLDAEMLPAWAKNNGLAGAHRRAGADQRASSSPSCRRRSTTPTPPSARPSRSASSRSSPGDFTEENGYLTPSLKLKRNVVMKDFHDDVEALYAPAASRS